MNDNQLLDRLRADLDEFVGLLGDAPDPSVLELAGPVPPRRPWVLVGAAAATLAVLVSGLVLLARDDTAEAPVATAGPDTVTSAVTAPPQPFEGMPVPPTPDGWQVVEWGDVRVSLPPELGVGPGPACSSTASDGSQLAITCGDRTLTILSGIVGTTIDAGVVRNGLTTELQPVPDLDGPTQLLIGDTQSVVRFTGFADDEIAAIVETVGVSSVWRAANEPPPPVPADWQTVQRDGYLFRVPADWRVTELPPELDPDVCGFAGDFSGVMIARGSLDASAINCAADSVLALPTDGVRVYPDDTGDGPRSLGNPYVSRIIDSVTPPQVILVGFGGDGTIGRTILGSLTVRDAPAPTVTTAPATPEPVTPWIQIEYQGEPYVIEIDQIPWPDDPDGWVPVEWGQIRFALPPELSPFDARTGCAASTWGEFDDHLRITCGDTAVEASTDLLADAPIVGAVDTIPVAEPDPDTIASPIYGGLRITGVDAATREGVFATTTVSTGFRSMNTYVGDDVSPWPTPDDWRWVRHGDIEFAVPPNWPVTSLSGDAADPDQCSFVNGDESLPGAIPTDAVLLGRGTVTSDADCDQPVLTPLRNGVRAFSTTEAERPSSVRAYDEADQALGGLRPSGIVVRVGVGADQLTSLTILGSIRPVEDETL